MKLKNKLLLMFLLLSLLFVVSSCEIVQLPQKPTQEITNKITNEVTNEITNKVINYENITIKDLETAVTNTYEILAPSVIGVLIKEVTEIKVNGKIVESEDSKQLGSGVIYKRVENLNEKGELTDYTYYAVTNRHVITGNSPKATYKTFVYLGSEDVEIEAQIVGKDEKVDMAVIKFNHYTPIQPVEFANSDDIKNGQFIMAIGNPDGFDYYGSITFGVVSGKLRYINDDTDGDGINDFSATYIQHDAAINSGNSGGGLFTIDGKYIGMNTLKLIGNNMEGMSFAVPSNVIKSLIENYIEKGVEIVRPKFGITAYEAKNLTPYAISQNGLKDIPNIYGGLRQYGLYVTNVYENTTASTTNIKQDDILLTFDGVKIINTSTLNSMLNSLTKYFVEDEVEITYYSRSQNKVVTETVTLMK